MNYHDLWRKLIRAQLDMIRLKGTPAHEEAKRIVREYEEALTVSRTISA